MLRKEEREGTEVMIVGKDTVMVRKKYDRPEHPVLQRCPDFPCAYCKCNSDL